MSEYRRDPFSGRWAIIAEGRGARPNQHAVGPPTVSLDPDCPFCEGHESRTPPETAAIRPPGGTPNGPGWSVRSIPNRFPTVDRESGPGAGPPGALERRPGRGTHEVVIESPHHAPGIAQWGPELLRPLFRFCRERVRALEGVPGTETVLLFENAGPESGGTLWHPHAQLVGTELRAPRVAQESRRFGDALPGECRLETAVAEELADGRRRLFDDPELVGFTPFASERPYEMRLVPRRHAPSFAEASDAEVDALADRLPSLLRALGRVVPAASYNWVVHGLPPGRADSERFHWHVEVLPRLVRSDGFELGAALEVNPVTPETAASALRQALDAPGPSESRKR